MAHNEESEVTEHSPYYRQWSSWGISCLILVLLRLSKESFKQQKLIQNEVTLVFVMTH